MFGMMQSTRACSKCMGKGKIIDSPCPKCNGSGVYQKKVTISVNIPAGISDGQTIRLSGKGNAGTNGGPRGDLKVRISVRPDRVFERDGDNIIVEVPLTYTQAALGAEIDIPTIDGTMKYTIPAGTFVVLYPSRSGRLPTRTARYSGWNCATYPRAAEVRPLISPSQERP